MPKSSHFRNGKPRHHRNTTFGSKVNGKVVGRKLEFNHLVERKIRRASLMRFLAEKKKQIVN